MYNMDEGTPALAVQMMVMVMVLLMRMVRMVVVVVVVDVMLMLVLTLVLAVVSAWRQYTHTPRPPYPLVPFLSANRSLPSDALLRY